MRLLFINYLIIGLLNMQRNWLRLLQAFSISYVVRHPKTLDHHLVNPPNLMTSFMNNTKCFSQQR